MHKIHVYISLVGILFLVGCSIMTDRTPTPIIILSETAVVLPENTAIPANTPVPTITLQPTIAPTLGIGSTRVSEIDGMTMVYIPAGSFIMGDSIEQARATCNSSWRGGNPGCDTQDFSNEAPPHKVTLNAYWIDQTEVTNGMYEKCVAAGFCTEPANKSSAKRESYYGNSVFDNYPVIYVNWYQAENYCEWAGGNLPTEAQWEHAGRGTEDLFFPWGNLMNEVRRLDSNGDTLRVGSDPNDISQFAVLDMSDYVNEWVSDYYNKDYYKYSPANDPKGPITGTYRVLRSGRLVDRYGENPLDIFAYVGFRCASSTKQNSFCVRIRYFESK